MMPEPPPATAPLGAIGEPLAAPHRFQLRE